MKLVLDAVVRFGIVACLCCFFDQTLLQGKWRDGRKESTANIHSELWIIEYGWD
jgi:hypothetical protein